MFNIILSAILAVYVFGYIKLLKLLFKGFVFVFETKIGLLEVVMFSIASIPMILFPPITIGILSVPFDTLMEEVIEKRVLPKYNQPK